MYNPRSRLPKNKDEFEILMLEIDKELSNLKISQRPIHVGILLSKWFNYTGSLFPEDRLAYNDIYDGDSLRAKTYLWYDLMYGQKLIVDFSLKSIPIKINNVIWEMVIPRAFGNVYFFLHPNLSYKGNKIYDGNVFNYIEGMTQKFVYVVKNEEYAYILNLFTDTTRAFNWMNSISTKINNENDLFKVSFRDFYSSTKNLFISNLEQSIWSSQQSIEKLIKKLLELGNHSYPKGYKGHNLEELGEELNNKTHIRVDQDLLKMANYSPNVRYGEISVTENDALAANNSFIQIIINLEKNPISKIYLNKHFP